MIAGSSTLQVRGHNPTTKGTGQWTFRAGKQAVEGPVIRSGVHGSDRLLAMRLYRLEVLKARSRDLIEREIISLRRDLWEMSNDLKSSLVRLYQQSLEDTQKENSTLDTKKTTRSKSRPSIFFANRKRPNYSDIDDDDRRRRAEKNSQSYLKLIDRYKPRTLGMVSSSKDSLSPDLSLLHLQKRSHTTMLPAKSGQAHLDGTKTGSGGSPDELFDLFVRMNTDTNLKLRQADAVSLDAKANSVQLPAELVGNSSMSSHRHGKKSSNQTHDGSDNESESQSTLNHLAESDNNKQSAKSKAKKKKKHLSKKKTPKKNDSENELFKIDFLDKEMRRKLLQHFDRNRSADNMGNGKGKSKVVVTMPQIIRDSQLSRRASILPKSKRGQADGSSLISATSGDNLAAIGQQLPVIANTAS